ncbi:MAG: four helix bundle protein [Desulfobacteraceae bacterium]|nr:four helix bundle protein [Desulfobacteraceae bacterium]MBC2718260.1 four helix bundle protein [Desulfobacteraceae bacterium]
MREAWAKRRYAAHFISKLTDADGENSETNTWLDFAKDCQSVGAMLGAMIKNPTSFMLKRPLNFFSDFRLPISDLRPFLTSDLRPLGNDIHSVVSVIDMRKSSMCKCWMP